MGNGLYLWERQFSQRKGVTISHSINLSGNMNDSSNCEAGIIDFPVGKTIGGQTAQASNNITVKEGFAKIIKVTGSLFQLAYRPGHQTSV